MRLLKVAVSYPKTHDVHTYLFDTAGSGSNILVGKTKRLGKHLAYCFGKDTVGTANVSAHMDINGETYMLERVHTEDGDIVTLSRVSGGVPFEIARDNEAYRYIEKLTHCTLAEVLDSYYIASTQFEQFGGVLDNIASFRSYNDIIRSVDKSTASIESKRQSVRTQVQDMVGEQAPTTTKQDIEELTSELISISQAINEVTAKLADMKTTHATGVITGEIMGELAKAQAEYDALFEQKEYIESQRERISRSDKIANLLPKIDRVALVGKQAKEIASERAQLTRELEWQENELTSAILQLEEKQRLATTVVDKRSKIDVINQELATMATLYAENKEHNEKLLVLAEQEQRLSAEKVMLRNKLSALESKVVEIKKHINEFSIPEQSIGELIEHARIDVKLDEVQSQIDKLTSELSIKESQIAERESNLVVQIKRFRSVAELDVAVSPIKAKDTILQVLDTKYNKLDVINTTLLDKKRNLQRSLEDYRYRILELEHSRAVLDKQLATMTERKQEEFKREVYLNSQKVYSDDASAVFAVVSDLEDEEVSTLRQDITKRSLDRDVLIERASELDGRISEISRQMDINTAEMATLRGEKANINTRYNEIIASNRSEAVFNYLKALESNNGTKYLLDVQNDAVRNEAELAELKNNTDSLRTKLSGLRSRYRYLQDTQSQLGNMASLDSLVANNDKMRDDLLDIGDRLSLSYEQQRSISSSLETCDHKLSQVRADIIEVTKTVKVNEKQIALSNDKACAYAGSNDLEEAINNFRYEITDIESERQMLVESKRQLEADVFRTRLANEKLQYNIHSKNSEADSLREEINLELSILGMSLESVYEQGLNQDMSDMRQVVAEYDSTKASLALRIDNYYTLLADHNVDTVDVGELVPQISALQRQLDTLTQEQHQLESSRMAKLEEYAVASNSKIKFAVAATSAETLVDMSQALEHNNIIKLLVSDKVEGIIRQAESVLVTLIGAKYNLHVEQGQLIIYSEGSAVSYSQLDSSEQLAIYLAITLACPDVDASSGRWIALDDKLPLDNTELVANLTDIQGMSYHTEYTITKGVR